MNFLRVFVPEQPRQDWHGGCLFTAFWAHTLLVTVLTIHWLNLARAPT